jgi:hypothetical protein
MMQGLARVLDGWKRIVHQHSLMRRSCLRLLLLGHPYLIKGIHYGDTGSSLLERRKQAALG